MATPPKFISWVGHGAASLAPPAAFSGVTAYVFTFDSQVTAIQRLVDTLLQPAAPAGVHYKPLLGRCAISFMHMDQCTSLADEIGWVPGRETAIWIPLLETSSKGHRVVFWTPYVFINYTIGMLTGREVWGWAKVGAKIRMGNDAPAQPAAFDCITTVFKTLDRTKPGADVPLLRVTSDKPLSAAQSGWGQWEQFAFEFLSKPGVAAVLDAHAIAGLRAGRIDAIAMKQIRDPADATLATLQAVVNSPAQVTGFRGAGLLEASAFELRIQNVESHRIVEALLGKSPVGNETSLPILQAAWLKFDFEALPGDPVN